ncbi:MAG: hypothetical protein JSV16_11820, partial [Candidatus Hydrogenedentota bacterium]
MDEFLNRALEMLIGRTSGPLTFRLIGAPTMASIFAIRAGLKDARKGREPYFYAILSNKTHRKFLFRQGWKDIGKVFVFMTVIDVIYQIIVFQWVYPGQVLIVATVLAIIPYLLMRG